MLRPRRYLVGAIALAGLLFATASAATAETCSLTLKRRDTSPSRFDAATYYFWYVQPQSFNMMLQVDPADKTKIQSVGNDEQTFKRIVKKEPKYKSAHPFRGVLKLGSEEYAFALDVVTDEKKADKKKDDEKKTDEKKAGGTDTATATDVVDSAEINSGSLLSAMSRMLGGGRGDQRPPKVAIPIEQIAYNRLYLDFNHNGDLTDDKVIDLSANAAGARSTSSNMVYQSFEFPRVDLTIGVDGVKLDYSFYFQGYSYSMENNCQVSVQAHSAVCREGDITLDGKKHHVVLMDFNSNGRFDDEMKISPDIHLSGGQVYAVPGDMMMVDPKTDGSATVFDSPYDPTSSTYRNYVTKMIPIDGKMYDVKISPTGDKLTLTRSTAATGNITNRNESFAALIYSDKGFLKIRGTKDKPVAVPEGDWKLYSYTITLAPQAEKPKLAENKAAAKTPAKKEGSLFGALAGLVGIGNNSGGTPIQLLNQPSIAAATATESYKPVKVRAGETVELPFGPPYKPTVEAMNMGGPQGQKQLRLSMSLVGVGGESLTNMTVRGSRPGKPSFTITDPQGKVVQNGDFEYG